MKPTYGKEEITDIMCRDNAYVCEVERIAWGKDGYEGDMGSDKLHEVLARLLHAQKQDNGLLRPIRRLDQVVAPEGFLWDSCGKDSYMPRMY